MIQPSQYMGLTIWDAPDDDFDHGELASNFVAIDQHKHVPGQGQQIPNAGLAPDAVTTDKILNYTILGEDLADGLIQPRHLSVNVRNPIGDVMMVLHLSNAQTWPNTYEPCLGQTLSWGTGVGQHQWPGFENTDLVLPDSRDLFARGVDASQIGKIIGGENTSDLRHTHLVNAHTHVVTSHTHTIFGHQHPIPSHVHRVPNHTHVIFWDGVHEHKFLGDDGNFHHLQQRGVGIKLDSALNFGWRQALYVPELNAATSWQLDSQQVVMEYTGSHGHTGFTGQSTGPYGDGSFDSGAWEGQSGVNSNYETGGSAPTTSATAPMTANGGNSAHENRPKNLGLLWLVKVRNV